MAITTLDGALAGMQYPREFAKNLTGTMVAGRPHSLFYLGGIPGAAAVPTPGIGGANLTTYAGQIPFSNPGAGNTYLSRFQGQATIAGTLLLCDRLWHNSSLNATIATEQVFTSAPTIPPRDANGLSIGHQVYAGVEVSTETGAGVPTLTFKYVNQDGTSGKTGTNIIPTVAASIAGTFYPIGLAAGDTGIRTPQSLTLNVTWTSGTIHCVLYRVLARLELTSANTPNALDLLTGGFNKLYNDTVPFLIFIPSTTTTSNICGQVIYSQG